MPAQPIDPPTIAITVSVNDSPLAGKEGSRVQSRVIRERLLREAEANVAVKVAETGEKDAFEVAGRGELQLGVLIETMRREGFEVSISRPRVVYRLDPQSGERLEPIEEVVIDLDDEYAGVVIDKLSGRRAELSGIGPAGVGKSRLTFLAPSRGLIGYQGEFLTDTRGTGVLNRVFAHYAPHKGPIEGRRNGVLVANSDGETSAYALWNLEERGGMFVGAGEKTYRGMIIGENAKSEDLDVNPMRAKQLTNVRARRAEQTVRLTPPRRLTLEQAIAYIADDRRWSRSRPRSIRLRKQVLDPTYRKRQVREDAWARWSTPSTRVCRWSSSPSCPGLAEERGAISLGQGFPDGPGPEGDPGEGGQWCSTATTSIRRWPASPNCARRSRATTPAIRASISTGRAKSPSPPAPQKHWRRPFSP